VSCLPDVQHEAWVAPGQICFASCEAVHPGHREPRLPGGFAQETTGEAGWHRWRTAALLRAQRIRTSRTRSCKPSSGHRGRCVGSSPLRAVRAVARGETCRASDEQAGVRLSVPAFAAVARLRRAARCCIRPRHPVLSFACPRRASLRPCAHTRAGSITCSWPSEIAPRQGSQNFAAPVGGWGEGNPVVELGLCVAGGARCKFLCPASRRLRRP